MRNRLSFAALALLICAAAGLAACGSSGASSGQATSTASTSTSGAALVCTFHERPQEADTVSVTIACTVTGAAASETSFTIAHFVAGPKGQGTAQDATCSGSLSGGAGACYVTITEQSTNAEPGTVTGALAPSHTTLGPVKPGIIP